MSMRSDYEAYQAAYRKAASGPMARYWVDQESRYVHPFRLYGNVWYVGDTWVCVHLIDTGDGLLLIDSGNCGTTGMLVQAIWEAGFNPADVKWIIHSHGHVDHIGAAMFFKRMFGTKLYLGRQDAQMFREHPEQALIHESGNIFDELFVPDYEIKEGDVLTFGNTTMTFYEVPGHTAGCIACFFDAFNGDEVRRCGYYGGFGFNTLQKAFLQEIGDDGFKMRQVYLDSIAKVRDQKVEIFLANHCINNDTLGRRDQLLADPTGPNPFVNDTLWASYLDEKRDALLQFMADPKNN